MKISLAILVLSVVAVLGDINADIARAKKYAQHRQQAALLARQCSEEMGFDYDTSLKLLLGDFSIRSPKAKCFTRCFFKKEGFINDADVPQTDFIINTLVETVNVSKGKIVEVYKRCSQFDVDDPCEKSYQFLECYMSDSDIKAAA